MKLQSFINGAMKTSEICIQTFSKRYSQMLQHKIINGGLSRHFFYSLISSGDFYLSGSRTIKEFIIGHTIAKLTPPKFLANAEKL